MAGNDGTVDAAAVGPRAANSNAGLDQAARTVLDFWFLPPTDPAHGQPRPQWFRKDPAFDATIRARFGPLIDAMARGELARWGDAPQARLARILVADQFTRNCWRNDPRAFALDPLARAEARALVADGGDLALSPAERAFAYLPFEHAEALAEQDEGVRRFAALAAEHPAWAESFDWCVRHRDVIARFGRFPHRNAILGRESTAAERQFLTEPGSRF